MISTFFLPIYILTTYTVTTTIFLLHIIYMYVYSLPIIYDKLPYMLHMFTKLVTCWRWLGYMAKHLRALYNKYKNTVQLVGSEICV